MRTSNLSPFAKYNRWYLSSASQYSIEDSNLVDELIKRQIPLEVCPISNAQTKACPDIAHHPILKLLDYGVCVTVNTDNRTVSNTNLNKEFDALRRELQMTDLQKNKLITNAYAARF